MILLHWFQYYMGLLLFAFGSGVLQALGLLGLFWRDRERKQAWVRRRVAGYLRFYFAYLRATGSLRVEFEGWKESFASCPGVIVANHPSMLDAPVFLRRLPRGFCVFKSSLARSVLRGSAPEAAGYINNADGVTGLRSGARAVRKQAQLVFFPEGTRTSGLVGTLYGSYALVAKYAEAPVHVFSISIDSDAFSKAHRLWLPPKLPVTMRVQYLQTVDASLYPTAAALHTEVTRILEPHFRVPPHATEAESTERGAFAAAPGLPMAEHARQE